MSGFPPAAPPPGQRFVRLRHPDSPAGAVTATFAASGTRPEAAAHPVVAELARHEPERAERVAHGLDHLLSREPEVLTWLEADPAHPALFAADPLAALRRALPDLPAGFFDDWRQAGEEGKEGR